MIYLDNAATTVPNKKALEKATQIYEQYFYNPSASYKQGAAVHALIEDCKRTILETLVNEDDLADYDIIFTGSGTEADNLALSVGGKTLISKHEHAAVYEFANNSGDCDLVSSDDDADLVSVCHVCSETGRITNIAEIARIAKERNPKCLFHSDGVQAYGKIPFKLTPEIDMYSISAHKIGGIKGIGALIVRKDVIPRLHPVIYGGGQGNGLRSGTENVFGIINFAEATKQWGREVYETDDVDFRLSFYASIVQRHRGLLWQLLDKNIFTRISPKDGSPYIFTVSAVGKNNEIIQQLLAERGILVGVGSACSSNHAENKGKVLRALGYGDEIINGALRFSFSPQTTVEEIRTAAKAVNEVVWSLS